MAWCSLTNPTSGIGSEDSRLLGCDALFLGEQFPKSRRVMVRSSSGVNSAGRTANPVTQHHITEELNPQEHKSTCLELWCMPRSAIRVSLLVCHLPLSLSTTVYYWNLWKIVLVTWFHKAHRGLHSTWLLSKSQISFVQEICDLARRGSMQSRYCSTVVRASECVYSRLEIGLWCVFVFLNAV
jgi:hypothetical protein